jgi:hypothetical protein
LRQLIESHIADHAAPVSPTAEEREAITLAALRKAISETKNGKTAKPETIIKAAKVNNSDGREVLRKMEAADEYQGFTRETPQRYRTKGSSVPER